jgi:hypothetical protein
LTAELGCGSGGGFAVVGEVCFSAGKGGAELDDCSLLGCLGPGGFLEGSLDANGGTLGEQPGCVRFGTTPALSIQLGAEQVDFCPALLLTVTQLLLSLVSLFYCAFALSHHLVVRSCCGVALSHCLVALP